MTQIATAVTRIRNLFIWIVDCLFCCRFGAIDASLFMVINWTIVMCVDGN